MLGPVGDLTRQLLLVSDVKESLIENYGFPTLQVVMAGTNNLRKYRGYYENPEKMLKCACGLIDDAKDMDVPKSHIVFVSLIPLPSRNDDCKHRFKHASDTLKRYAHENPNTLSFLNLEHIFLENGQIDTSLYDQKEKDQKHLNRQNEDTQPSCFKYCKTRSKIA